jgi:hypothetical protein
MPESFPDFLPDDMIIRDTEPVSGLELGECDGSESDSYDDKIYVFELTEKIFRFLSVVVELLPNEEGILRHSFFDSIVWKIYEESLLCLSSELVDEIISRLPLVCFSVSKKFSEKYENRISQEISMRKFSPIQLDSVLDGLRIRYREAFSQSEPEGAYLVVSDIDTVIYKGSYDEKASLLAGLLPSLYTHESGDYKDWVSQIDIRLYSHELVRFLLWVSISPMVRWDPATYPFFKKEFLPDHGDEIGIESMYYIDDLVHLFFDFIACADLEDLAQLESFFPEDFFLSNIDHRLAWSRIEHYCESISNRTACKYSDIDIISDFMNLFLVEDENEDMFFSQKLLRQIHEAHLTFEEENSSDES